MTLKKILYLVSILFAVIIIIVWKYNNSAHSKEVFDDKGNVVGKVFYRNKKLSSISKINKFYPDGKLEVIEFEKGTFNGSDNIYFPNGKLRRKSFLLDGEIDGVSQTFSESGSLESSIRWKAGKQFGDALFYRNDGKLELYNAVDFLDSCFYYIEFDSAGIQGLVEGKVVSPNMMIRSNNENGKSSYLANKNENLFLGKGQQLHAAVANPPNTQQLVSYEIFSDEKLRSRGILPVKNNLIIFKNPLLEGGYNFSIEIKLIDIRTSRLIAIDRIRGHLV
jgi:hypothetical protein